MSEDPLADPEEPLLTFIAKNILYIILGPGGFKFMDYVKAGTGLVIVCFVISLILIPMFWPFFPGK